MKKGKFFSGLWALVLSVAGWAAGDSAPEAAVSRQTLLKRVEAVRAESVALALMDMEAQWPGSVTFKAEALQPALVRLRERLADAKDLAAETEAQALLGEIRAALLGLPLLKEAKLLLVRPRRSNDYLGELALHWDGKRLMFSSQNGKGRMRVCEVSLDAPENVVERPQIPDDDVDNLAGCWLADDATLFLSTATMIGVPCVRGGSHIYHLYRQDPEGVRRLTFDQEHNWNPVMLPDGRVLYQRWEYSDLPHYVARILFTMNPDGTAQREYYGSNSYWPNARFCAKPVPGGAGTFAAIVTGHHGVPRISRPPILRSRNMCATTRWKATCIC